MKNNKLIRKFLVSAAVVCSVLFVSAGTGVICVKAAAFEDKVYQEMSSERCDEVQSSKSGETAWMPTATSTYDGYYGHQLTGLSRELYNEIVEYYANQKGIGNHKYELAAPIQFKPEIVDGKLVVNDSFEAARDTLRAAFLPARASFLNDYPEEGFWIYNINYTYTYSWAGSGGNYTGKITAVTFNPVAIYDNAWEKADAYEAAVDKAVADIKAGLAEDADRFDTVKAIHDYICKQNEYEYEKSYKIYSSEPAFLGAHRMVCEGYSETMKVLCDRFRIKCAIIEGADYKAEKQTLNHAWNYVQMEDAKWYLVDVTWDDQDNKTDYTYFLAGRSSMGFRLVINEERKEMTDLKGCGYSKFVYPVLAERKYRCVTHNWSSSKIVKQPTCTEEGQKRYYCFNCDATKTKTIAKKAHNYQTKVVKATLTKDGYLCDQCTDCGKYTGSRTIIYHPKKIQLSAETFTYTGNAKKPVVKVVGSDGTLIESQNYKLTYSSGRKKVGTYKVKITFKGYYSGAKTYTFKINPKGTSISSLQAGKKKFVVRWKKNTTQTTGYQIQYATDSKFKAMAYKTITRNTAGKKTITGLKPGKKYYVRIRTYKVVNGKKYYSKWSAVKKVKTMK